LLEAKANQKFSPSQISKMVEAKNKIEEPLANCPIKIN
jgi:hypothetical protein